MGTLIGRLCARHFVKLATPGAPLPNSMPVTRPTSVPQGGRKLASAEWNLQECGKFWTLPASPVTISPMGGPLLVGSRRDFLIGACAFLLRQTRRKMLQPALPSVVSPIRFREIAGQAGLNFVLQNNPTPRKHMIETMPGGVAAFDYNGDGLTDIFFTNGALIPSMEKDSPKFF